MNFQPGMPVMVEIAGTEYEIRFSLRVLKELHRKGVSLMSGERDIFTNPEKLSLLLYHGLLAKHPDITLEWLDENVDSAMLIQMAPAISFAISGREPTPPNPNVQGPPVNGTGSLSGPSDVTTSVSTNLPSGN